MKAESESDYDLSDCESGDDSECKVTQVKCVGNNKWKLEDGNQCRACKTDKECLNIKKGNKCKDGVCLKEMLFFGLDQNCYFIMIVI